MRTNQAVRSSRGLTDNPERVGPALAQVIHIEDGVESVLGQAWLAASDRMVTCGHVVDRFVQSPESLFLFFPASGNRYPVLQVRLHPSFVRQPDGLVKFDAAVLAVQLGNPESDALPLPFSYEHSLKTNQSIATVRYPAHLGQLSSAMQPLTQDGRFLGLLRKHDSFHLLHDLPLSPGDSGAPICDGQRVIAVHCGDTATLPGLNLPTTSIRLALWVDALRDLGVPENRNTSVPVPGLKPIFAATLAFLLALGIGIGAAIMLTPPAPAPIKAENPPMMPVQVKFNERLDAYKLNEVVEIFLVPRTPAYLFVFLTDEHDGRMVQLFPGRGQTELVKDSVKVDQGAQGQILASEKQHKLHVLAVHDGPKSSEILTRLFPSDGWYDKGKGWLKTTGRKMSEHIRELQQEFPGQLFEHVFDSPHVSQ